MFEKMSFFYLISNAMTFYMLQGLPKYFQESVNLSFCQFCKMLVFLFTSAVAPDFSNSVLKAQTLARQGGDVLIEWQAPHVSARDDLLEEGQRGPTREPQVFLPTHFPLSAKNLFIKVIQTEQYDPGQAEGCYWSKPWLFTSKRLNNTSRCICIYLI